ncbi:MAG: carbohydrate kinase family protein [Eubacterium sp.]|nr:carbohydrate kinase family protein [Eubacterium sp.]
MSFIAGAGSLNIDLLYSGMERIPDVGEELFSKDFSIQLGGGIPATLINLSRLGIKTRLITQLGEDMLSGFAKNELEKAGAEYRNVYCGSGIPLTVTSAVILEDDRTFFSYSGYTEPDGKMEDEFFNNAKGAKIVLMQVGGYLDVYKKLRENGSILVLDTGWDDSMSFETYSDYLDIADYYTPNRKEALKITGASTVDDAADILKKYFDRVIVKLDRDGCLGIDGEEKFIVPEISEFVNVDSTGAGDAFLAGLCYGIYHGFSLRESVLYGNITGGKAVTAVGALGAYLNEKELLEAAERYK